MSDTAIRAAEATVERDPTAWRPLLALLLRAGRAQAALAMLQRCEERVIEEGRGLALAAQNEAISGATERPAQAAMCANAARVLQLCDAIVALENDIAFGKHGAVA